MKYFITGVLFSMLMSSGYIIGNILFAQEVELPADDKVICEQVIEEEKEIPFIEKIETIQKEYYRENGKFKQIYEAGDGLEVHVYEMPNGEHGYKIVQNYSDRIEIDDRGPANSSGVYNRNIQKDGVWKSKYKINEAIF